MKNHENIYTLSLKKSNLTNNNIKIAQKHTKYEIKSNSIVCANNVSKKIRIQIINSIPNI